VKFDLRSIVTLVIARPNYDYSSVGGRIVKSLVNIYLSLFGIERTDSVRFTLVQVFPNWYEPIE
jgi:hypothetical protein